MNIYDFYDNAVSANSQLQKKVEVNTRLTTEQISQPKIDRILNQSFNTFYNWAMNATKELPEEIYEFIRSNANESFLPANLSFYFYNDQFNGGICMIPQHNNHSKELFFESFETIPAPTCRELEEITNGFSIEIMDLELSRPNHITFIIGNNKLESDDYIRPNADIEEALLRQQYLFDYSINTFYVEVDF